MKKEIRKEDALCILKNWSEFESVLNEAFRIKGEIEGYKPPTLDIEGLSDNEDDVKIYLDIIPEDKEIELRWTETSYSGCSGYESERRELSITFDELTEELEGNQYDYQERIDELEKRLYEETNRRRELERSKP